ncbi:MAG: sugar ABC transporter permease [Bauldia sp.]|nr:sugar ABC transporter permease [Bauldia sp.]
MTSADPSRHHDPDHRRSVVGRWLTARVNIFVVLPTVLIVIYFVYGFVSWTGALSFTDSKTIPRFEFIGFTQYVSLWSNSRWHASVTNLVVFTIGFVGISTAVGLLLAILLDQKIKAEGLFRTIYLYPLAISFIVTGTAWKWALNPGLGLEKLMHDWGFTSFQFDWIANPDRAIYTLIIAAVWQGSGFAMAVFLATIRGVDPEIVKAAKIDGAGMVRTYWSVVMPLLRPAFLTVFIIMVALAIRTFDLMVAMTGGGPGFATDLPTNFMYQFAFGRQRLGLAAASAIMIFVSVLALMIPFIYGELRREARRER